MEANMKFYLIGIKGSGMSTLANLLYDLKCDVCGYDDCMEYKFTMKGLEERGIKIYTKDNYPELSKDTYVTYTAAINEDHHEVKRLKELGYTILPYHRLIGWLTQAMDSICVCGTHGKTTTSLMIAKMLQETVGCSYFVGDGTGHGDKNSNLFVLESCEFNKHFLSYSPNNIVITNIELDHTETYPTIELMIDAYQEFVNKCENMVIACGDDQNIRKLNIENGYFYGFNEKNDLVIKNKEVINGKTSFDVYYKGIFFDHYVLPIFGDHLILDAAAAILIGINLSIRKEMINYTLRNYEPAKRRFNEKIIDDIVIIDDYAHHPTEIKVTYDSAHQKYPNKEKVAVFLPNTYSRTQDLFDDFVDALKIYDKAYVMDIKCDRENKDDYPLISSERIVDQVPNSEMISLDSCDKLLKHKNSVICFMSCANISPMINKYCDLLKK